MSEGRLFSNKPEDIEWRVAQMHASSRIEGIERDPEYAQFMDELEARGVPPAERISKFIEFLKARNAVAAE